MAADFFLKLGDIKGESKDSNQKDEIELLSWSWGESQSGTFGTGGGGGSGKVNMQDFNFTMTMNSASTAVALACATGAHIKEATLTARKAGGKQEKYLVVTLNDLLVSSYHTGGSDGAGIPVDSFSLNFTKIATTYFKQDEKGATSKAGDWKYDLGANKAG